MFVSELMFKEVKIHYFMFGRDKDIFQMALASMDWLHITTTSRGIQEGLQAAFSGHWIFGLSLIKKLYAVILL